MQVTAMAVSTTAVSTTLVVTEARARTGGCEGSRTLARSCASDRRRSVRKRLRCRGTNGAAGTRETTARRHARGRSRWKNGKVVQRYCVVCLCVVVCVCVCVVCLCLFFILVYFPQHPLPRCLSFLCFSIDVDSWRTFYFSSLFVLFFNCYFQLLLFCVLCPMIFFFWELMLQPGFFLSSFFLLAIALTESELES